ncbi:MAG TPA: T9SS type A sorting domain-containing protein [Flavobacteriales bacterium]|nr:T9SS type A sorting domain-containing protein [Flavobacteriales bacterium]
MKHIYTIFLLLFIFFTNKAFSQTNSYFQNNPVWHVEFNVNSGWDCAGYNSSYNYYLNGDTVLYGNTYKQVHKKGIVTYISASCTPTGSDTIADTAVFYLRSLSKKMFVLYPSDTAEKLLYDFNLNMGDTVPQTYAHDGAFTFIVSSIDSINTPNGYLKKFYLATSGGPGNDTLYEGIGSTGGLVEQIFPFFLSGSHKLLCYALNNNSYIYSSGSTCDALSAIPESENQNVHSVFPNPFEAETNFHFNSDLKNATLNVYNTSGVKVKTHHFSGNYFKIQKDDLAPGVYFYLINQGANRLGSGKLLKQ